VLRLQGLDGVMPDGKGRHVSGQAAAPGLVLSMYLVEGCLSCLARACELAFLATLASRAGTGIGPSADAGGIA